MSDHHRYSTGAVMLVSLQAVGVAEVPLNVTVTLG
jgi:hypothetical protein